MRLSCAGSFASAFQKLLTQSTPRVRMMSSYTAFTSALASAYSMSVTSDTLPSMRFGYISKVIEWLAGLDPQVLLLGFAVLGIALALPLVVVALGRLRRLRLAGSAFYLLLGAFLALLGVAAGLTAASLRTYQRLAHEQLAARGSTCGPSSGGTIASCPSPTPSTAAPPTCRSRKTPATPSRYRLSAWWCGRRTVPRAAR